MSLDFTYRQRRLLVVASAASSLVRDVLEHIIHKGVRDRVRDASVWVGLLDHTVYVYNPVGLQRVYSSWLLRQPAFVLFWFAFQVPWCVPRIVKCISPAVSVC